MMYTKKRVGPRIEPCGTPIESKALAWLMKTAAQYCLLSMEVTISFRTLSVAEVHPLPARKPHCIAEKVRWDSKWSVIWLLTWLSKTLEMQSRMDIGLLQFGSRVSPSLKRGMTAAVFQSLGISDDEREVEQASNRGCNNCGG